MKDVIRIWKEKGKILEGIRNNIFKKADVEHIAAERIATCEACPHMDTTGDKCVVPGTGPCCGLCGCSLSLKTRALSASCDDKRWDAVLSEDEQMLVERQISLEDDTL